jgi:hypothetical protein
MKPTARTITTLVGGAALILTTAGLANAQQTTPDPATKQTRAKKGDGSGQDPAQGAQNAAGATRRLGPAEGTGNAGVKPQDGTGNGSPGRLGARSSGGSKAARGSAGAKGSGSTAGKASKKRAGPSGADGNGQGHLTRSRARNVSRSGSSTCTQTGAGSRGAARGAGSSGGAGRR